MSGVLSLGILPVYGSRFSSIVRRFVEEEDRERNSQVKCSDSITLSIRPTANLCLPELQLSWHIIAIPGFVTWGALVDVTCRIEMSRYRANVARKDLASQDSDFTFKLSIAAVLRRAWYTLAALVRRMFEAR